MELRIKKLHPDAMMPRYASEGAACFDLHAFLPDGDAAISTLAFPTVVIPTGLAFEIPPGWAMLVYSRSGHGFKDNIRLANCVGIIDSDYRGEVQVKLTRDDRGTLFFRHGDRIAQAMLVQVPQVLLVEVDDLSETARGEGGFGSTGTGASAQEQRDPNACQRCGYRRHGEPASFCDECNAEAAASVQEQAFLETAMHGQSAVTTSADGTERIATPEEVRKFTAAREAIENNWQPHDGGPMPCDGDTYVEVQFRCGKQSKERAYVFGWNHGSCCAETDPYDIVAWRVA